MLRSPLVGNGQVQVHWPTVPGKVYAVQYSTDLISWVNLATNVFGDGSIATVGDPAAVAQAQARYYRVVITGF